MASFEELIDGLPTIFRKINALLRKLWTGDSTRDLEVNDLTVGGDQTVAGTLDVVGVATVDDLTVGGDQTVGGTLGVTGLTSVTSLTSDTGMSVDSVNTNGIKIENQFGWQDLLGDIDTRGFGGSEPTFAVYQGGIRWYQFTVNDVVFNAYHIPHDYAIGTDLHIHIHWSHNDGSVISGGVTWEFEIMYAKGHDQAPFTIKTLSVQQDASTTQYQHMLAEVQMTAETADGTHFDRDDFEADGVIMIVTKLTGNTINGTPAPFVHYVDIHYQSTGLPTKEKSPDFYT